MNSNDHVMESIKVSIAWVGGLIGTLLGQVAAYLTLSNVVLSATLVYTVLQIFILARDKVFRRRTSTED
ncbi:MULTISPECIES: hypothetical protein [Burkholderiaceae]|uniref:Uncharacterized protein n=1 Tax=Paraburkholderia eburnea TaxID=1189126 RepID=A0A2S4LXD3_9BURK|nr:MULTISPECIES: hypothetical protein [Burkholderiaceae]ARK96175.1 hypothetical protein BOC43_17010 [Burkholderia pseudomallei]POR47048.1 hypothetical protein B0G62_12041 [Paraburkholderia eburnea]PRZ18278.1 hypothetical protein BX588_12041 [Paraburkholderia eburnea]